MKNHGNQPKTMKNHENTLKNHGNHHNNFGRGRGGGAGISKNVTYAGSQLTRGGGQGRNKQKRHLRGVTTDLLDVYIMAVVKLSEIQKFHSN